MSYISLIVALVAVMNPFGNIPIIIQQTQEIPKARIKWIITREMIFSVKPIEN